MRKDVLFLALPAVLIGLSGCASAPEPIAFENRVFYEGDVGTEDDLRRLLEKPWDPLDWQSPTGRVHDGIEIMGGVARISRPSDWVIRRGSVRPEGRFIEYVSPRQVVFSVYERIESPRDDWNRLIQRYTTETKEQGGDLLGGAVPFATLTNQARAFDVRRGVPAGTSPLVGHSREYLARSAHRIVLIQVVRPREEFGAAQDELTRVVGTLTVL